MVIPHLTIGVLLLAGPLVVAPNDLENAFDNLKQAVAKQDATQVKKLAAQTWAMVRQEMSEPAPADADAKDAWEKHVAWVKDVGVYTEYSLYATALQSAPAVSVDLFSALEQQNPKSKYLDEAYSRYFVALHQTGGAAKIPAIAEKALAHFPNNEDLLTVAADSALTRKQSDRALTYSERLLNILSKHPKPEGVTAPEWERKRSTMLTRAHWMAGVLQAEKNQYMDADRNLRAALPAIKGNEPMMGPALFYLGVVNYQLGKMTLNRARVLEAASFSDQAAAIAGPYAQQAWRNSAAMKSEAARMR